MADLSIKATINDLPVEILVQILSILSSKAPSHSSLHRESQKTLHSCVLVSRLWYNLTLEYLYSNPIFTSRGSTFQSFVNTICPSVNAHVKKSDCANMVRKLDMSRLVHEGSKSLTARILSRCKTRLEEFTAPQASFAYVLGPLDQSYSVLTKDSINSLAPLSKCSNLRYLNLSWISGAIDLAAFFSSISKLDKLECLYFPRSCQNGTGAGQRTGLWPPNLRELHISGYLGQDSLSFFSNYPPSLNKLCIESNHRLPLICTIHLLTSLGPQLNTLVIGNPMKGFLLFDMADLLYDLPVIRVLSIPADCVSCGSIKESKPGSKYRSSLVELQLNPCFGREGPFVQMIFGKLVEAIEDGRLRKLRKVKIHKKFIKQEEGRKAVGELDALLEKLAQGDELDSDSGEKISRGVWLIGK